MSVASFAIGKRAIGAGSPPLPPTDDCFEAFIGLITTTAGFIGIINTDAIGLQGNVHPEVLFQGHIDPNDIAFDNELCEC